MFFFKKSAPLNYVKLAKSHKDSLLGVIILSLYKLIKNEDRTDYKFVVSDFGIFEIMILVFVTLRVTMDEKYQETINGLYTDFLELSSFIFKTPEDKIYEIANERGQRYFKHLKTDDSIHDISSMCCGYIYKGMSTNSIIKDSSIDYISPSFTGPLFIGIIYDGMLNTLASTIEGAES